MTPEGNRHEGPSGPTHDTAVARPQDASIKRVAIIGGGLGGLTAAFFLQGMQDRDRRVSFSCEIFEASGRMGGNMCSAYFETPYEAPFADLAVNDFNATTYKNLMALIQTLAKAGYEVPIGELIDKDAYFIPAREGQPPMSFTSDEVANPESAPQKPYLPRLKSDWERFGALAADVMQDPKYATMSVDEFVRTEGFSDEFRDLMLLPRINAMYFMTEGDPGRMPIRGVMFYYNLQEGLGSDAGPARRMFFRNGASQWALQLERFVRARGSLVHLQAPARVSSAGGKLVVSWPEGNGIRQAPFDHVVCAVPPHRVGEVLDTVPPDLAAGLKGFGVYPATALVHQDPRVLPADKSQWMTYNVLIERPGQMQPYTISYVNAMHNGEPLQGPPFVTENPIVDISEGDVYGMIDLSDPHGKRRIPARMPFTHNTVSAETMAFQEQLSRFQGRGGVHFTGGWTNGAGLQEQIIATSIHVALRIRGFEDAAFHPTHSREGLHYAPHYLRRSLKGAKAEPYPEGFWPDAPRPGKA